MATRAIFIDSRVTADATFLAQFNAADLVITLDDQSDGWSQIAQSLQGQTGLESIHIVSHGDVGQLQIGSSLLDQAGLDARADILATIGQSLAEQADLMLYGCKVAQGDSGQTFVMRLAELTGADVAASVDITGPTLAGGDSVLEFSSGGIEAAQINSTTQLAISATAQNAFDYNDALTAAEVAQAAYLAPNSSALAIFYDQTGWQPAGYMEVGANYAMASKRMLADGTIQYSIGFEGSNANQLTDWLVTNFSEYGWSNYYSSLMPLVASTLDDALTEKIENGKNIEILFAGHSLGGAAAEVAMADLYMNPGQDFWFEAGAPLTNGNRIYDMLRPLGASPSHPIGWSNDEIRSLLASTSVYTFGAPSFLIDSSKLPALSVDASLVPLILQGLVNVAVDIAATPLISIFKALYDFPGFLGTAQNILTHINDGTFSTLILNEIEKSVVTGIMVGLSMDILVSIQSDPQILSDLVGFESSAFQFEHGALANASTALDIAKLIDPVATLGTFDAGTVITIPNSDAMAARWGPLFGIGGLLSYHSVDGYVESILRLLSGRALGNDLLAGQVLPIATTSSPDSNLYMADATVNAGAGNDLIILSGDGAIVNGDAGDDAFVVSARQIAGDGHRTYTIEATPGEIRDTLYIVGNGSRKIDALISGDDLSLSFFNDATGRTEIIVKNWYAADPTQTYRFTDIIEIDSNAATAWNATHHLIQIDDAAAAAQGIRGLGGLAHGIAMPNLLIGDGNDNVVFGTNLSDSMIKGSFGRDYIDGRGGNDQIYGDLVDPIDLQYGDDDRIEGGDGDDTVYGGGGNDTISGGDGIDSIMGGDGADDLTAWNANDFLSGGQGQDTYNVQLHDGGQIRIKDSTNNVVANGVNRLNIFSEGLDYHQTTFVSNGIDLLVEIKDSQGAPLGTVLIEGLATDVALMGGTLQSTGTSVEVVFSTVMAEASLPANIGTHYTFTQFGAVVADGSAGRNGPDTLNGTSSNNLLRGFGGNDTLDGGAGDDTLDGGAGNDSIVANNGFDFVLGGTGSDDVIGFRGNFDGGTGLDTLRIDQTTSRNFQGGTTFTSLQAADSSSIFVGTVNAQSSAQLIRQVLQNGVTFLSVDNVTVFTGLSTQVQITWTNFERWVLPNGNQGSDLIIAQQWQPGTYTGGDGFDALFADWSFSTSAITWINTPAALQNLGNGYSVSGFERMVITTGAGDFADTIDNRGQGSISDEVVSQGGNDVILIDGGKVDAGAGNDQVTIATTTASTVDLGAGDDRVTLTAGTVLAGDGNDLVTMHSGTVDGGAGVDTLLIDQTTSGNFQGGTTFTSLQAADSSSIFVGTVNAQSSAQLIRQVLQDGVTFLSVDNVTVFTGLSTQVQITWTNFERWVLPNGNQGSDLIIAQQWQPGTYTGGDGFDALFADWSFSTSAITWINTPAVTQDLGNGYSVSGFERMVIATGAGDFADTIDNRGQGSISDEVVSQGGNDVIAIDGGKVDAGAGNDQVTIATTTASTVDLGAGDDRVSLTAGTVLAGDGNDLVTMHSGTANGGGGVDTLLIDQTTYRSIAGSTTVTSLQVYDSLGTFIGAVDAQSSGQQLRQLLQNGVTFMSVDTVTVFGSQVQATWSNFERWTLPNGNQGSDLIIAQQWQPGTYTGGDGFDALYADWSFSTSAITWVNTPAVTQALGNGYSVAGFERLIVTTGSGNDRISNSTNDAADEISTGLGNDTIDGGLGADTMIGGDGSDTYTVDNIGDVVTETNALAAGGTDLVNSLLGAYTLGANIENGRVSAAGAANLTGNILANTLFAGDGVNVLDGGAGLDTASYAFATAAVTVSLSLRGAQATGGSGSDTLVSIENLTGSNFADTLTGDAAANVLTGGLGADTLIGGDGSDTYIVDNLGDVVTESNALAAGGTDLVNSLLSAYTLAANVENGRVSAAGTANLTGNTLANTLFAGVGANVLDGAAGLDTASYAFATAAVSLNLALTGAQTTGSSGSDTLVSIENLTGSNFADTLTGNTAANLLTGGLGADTMTGGDGNDTYVVDNAGDVVSETNALAAGGTDQVNFSLAAYTLTANVENGRILSTNAANLTGNTLANTLFAGVGNNVLDGGTGLDTASYALAAAAVTVNLSLATAQATGGSGSDTLVSIENLSGSNFADTLTGNAAANSLNGGVGADTMTGGDGSDTYTVDNIGDLVTETNAATAGGTDLVNSLLGAYTLGANIENGLILATGAANLTGNTLANTLFAGVGANVLDGSAGLDTASYAFATAAISVSLALAGAQATGNSGSDTLVSIENLTGSNFADTLTGNATANFLTGGLGADTLIGGDGSDTYVVDHIGDVVTESNALAAGGTDQVNSSLAAYTLGANVENGRILAIGAANITGNTLANTLFAGVGANVLDGGAGLDTVSYALATAGVAVNLGLAGAQITGASGSDTLIGIENLTGSNFADTLTGNAAANVLSGGLGADLMTGGDGNDTYTVDNAADVVNETNALTAGGLDLVNTSLAAYTLGTNVESGRILSTGAANLTGNALANLLYAGTGNNVIDGGAGTDTASYALATSAVNVKLNVAGAQATGGSGSDTLVGIENLTGSNFADTLTGDAVANVLNGGAGVDTMLGGDGNDTYTVDNIGDVVTEANALAAGGTDLVNSLLGAYTLGANVENGRVSATGAANLTGNSLTNTLFAGAGANLLDGGAGLDTASYAFATAGITVSLALSVAQFTGGSGSDTLIGIEHLTGSNFNDSLTGDGNANVLGGGTGADTLAGGAGIDTLLGGAGNDVYVFDTALNGTTNVDRIGDYAAGDLISLDNDVFTTLGLAGTLGASQFQGGAGLTGGSGSGGIYYNVTTGDLYYDPDGAGAAAAVRFANLTGAPSLTAASFEVRD